MTNPRLFALHRDRDVTGVSGTGIVADGCAWPDGTVSIRWRGERPSTVSWNSIADAEHVHGHGGATHIVWAAPEGAVIPPGGNAEDCPRCVCGDPIEWMNHPDGSGWIHSPGSDTRCLDARPAAPGWTDGDPIMEAIAAAVWQHCATEDTSTVRDDPRNIAAAAARVARRHTEPACRWPICLPAPEQQAICDQINQDIVRTVPDPSRTPDTEQDIDHEFRDALGILLSRVRRGVQSAGEADLLAGHVEHILRRLDQTTAGRATWKAKAEEMERDRDRSDEAARRMLEQRQEMAAERYTWQERGRKAERAADLLAGSHRRAEESEATLGRVRTHLDELRRHQAEAHPSERMKCVMCGTDPADDLARALDGPASEPNPPRPSDTEG